MKPIRVSAALLFNTLIATKQILEGKGAHSKCSNILIIILEIIYLYPNLIYGCFMRSVQIMRREPLVKVKAKSAKNMLNIKQYKREFINTKLVFRSKIFCSVFR